MSYEIYERLYNGKRGPLPRIPRAPAHPTLPMIEAAKIKDDAPKSVNKVLHKQLPPKLTPDEALHNLKRNDYETENFYYFEQIVESLKSRLYGGIKSCDRNEIRAKIRDANFFKKFSQNKER